MTMKTELAAFKRQRILQEASRLFFDHGYSGTSVDAIANRLSVTKPYIYRQFSSKSEMLTEIYLQVLRMSVDAIQSAQDSSGSTIDRLAQFSIAIAKICAEHQHIIAIFFREEVNLPESSIQKIYEVKKDFDNRLTSLLREGISSGHFVIDDVGICSQAISGMLTWVHIWYRKDGRLNSDEMSAKMADLVVKLVVPNDGRLTSRKRSKGNLPDPT